MGKRRFSIVWTSPAHQGLLEVIQYIKNDNPEGARRFGKTIKEKISRLEEFPQSGRNVPEFPGSGLKEVIVGDYRIIYRVILVKFRVEVLTVRHGAKSFEDEENTQIERK